jgi:hypothetical protein
MTPMLLIHARSDVGDGTNQSSHITILLIVSKLL